MRKKLQLAAAIAALSFTVPAITAQISVSSSHTGGVGEFKKGEFERFKGTTTIFILSSKFSKAE